MRRFTVPGEPKPKQRPRVSVVSGRITHAYTPAETVAYEAKVRNAYMDAYPAALPFPKLTPLEVEAVFYLPIPASWSRKAREKAEAGRKTPTKRPDLDNLLKAILDAVNGIAWADDCQIIRTVCEKRYGEPRAEITIRETDMSGTGGGDPDDSMAFT